MAKDRPDIYTVEGATEELDRIMNSMREEEGSGLSSFADYFLIRYVDDGVEEWSLARKLASVALIDGDVSVCSHTHRSGTLEVGVDLPPVQMYLDDDDDDVDTD